MNLIKQVQFQQSAFVLVTVEHDWTSSFHFEKVEHFYGELFLHQ